MSKGFLVIAQNTENVDYVKQAYALALSIKATQSTVTNISVVTNDPVPEEYRNVFDQVIEILWSDDAKDSNWKVENRWKMYYQSPYDETIVLDTDMLFLEDISSWWEHCEGSDLKFCSRIKNYRNELIEQDTYHRKAFISNGLSNPYTALHYFKKSDLALTFYKVLTFVVRNWQLCYQKFAPQNYQPWLSIDLAAAIAIEIMDVESLVIDKYSPLEFVHMKLPLQGADTNNAYWQDLFYQHFNKNYDLVIGNYKQQYLFHYVEKDFLNDNLIFKLEQRVKNGRT